MRSHRGATYDQLMKHMRSSGIEISGSLQKRQLLLSGYYHGYKGCRYCKDPKIKIPFHSFSQVQDVIDFDEGIKSCLYSPVLQFETALKSIVSDIVIKEAGSDSFSDIIERLMHSSLHSDQSSFIKRKYEMRDEIYSYVTKSYKRGNIVKHYYDRDVYVPIWAIFEVITLGQFGLFVDLLDPQIKLIISNELGIPVKFNADGKLLSSIVFMITDLRNAIAHNSVVFDCRFKGNRKIDQTLSVWLTKETNIEQIHFLSITDYIILICTLMKLLKFRKSPLYSLTRRICALDEKLFTSVGSKIYMQIFSTDTRKKHLALDHYLHAR